jgi:hypothetical protein
MKLADCRLVNLFIDAHCYYINGYKNYSFEHLLQTLNIEWNYISLYHYVTKTHYDGIEVQLNNKKINIDVPEYRYYLSKLQRDSVYRCMKQIFNDDIRIAIQKYLLEAL